MILDSTAIVDLLRGNHEIINKLRALEKTNTPIDTTSVSVFEIWKGTSAISSKEEIDKIIYMLESISTLPLDAISAKEAGLIHARLKSTGMEVAPEDCMIAGIAKVNNETLVTRNIKLFSRINGLKIENY